MMIGITVGMLGMLAVSTVFVSFNKHRTVETSLMEAQSNGAMALYLLERDLDRAGYAFMELQGCTCTYVSGGGATLTSNPAFCERRPSDVLVHAQSAIPLFITDGGNQSDSIFIQYGTPGGGLPISQVLTKQNDVSDDFQLKSIAGITVNDKLVMNRGGACALYQATDFSGSLKTVVHAQNTINPDPTAWPAVGYDTAFPDDQLINLGQYVSKNFHVDEAAAQLLENTGPQYDNDTPVVENIVYLKAEVGIDTDGDKRVNSWSKPASITDYGAVAAIRVGVVARSQATENDSPTAATLEVLPAITGGAKQDYTVPDRKFRYKVYYTIIPLRNMLWHG
jgi:type IV pilus assembly protein PilW